MGKKLKVDGDYIKDGSRKVAKIKRDCIYEGNSTSSSNLLAYMRNDKFYSKKVASSSYCIGMIKNGYIYNDDSSSSRNRIGKFRDAERVIDGRCSDEVLGAVYLLMERGDL
tara:strand:+ start:67 stop:399 length:333 start_codon:yes stop_codon:yes gene_type:complete